ncbi:MAG: hypothetical protein AB7C90_02360 [Bacteroidales bacterium]
MEKVIEYLANDWEDAVVKVMDNGDRYVKLTSQREVKARPENDVAYGTLENWLFPITEREYNTFFVTWHFGQRIGCKKTDMGGNLL